MAASVTSQVSFLFISFIWLFYITLQVISPELTFYNSSKYVGESPLFSNKFLHARLDAFCRSLFLTYMNAIDYLNFLYNFGLFHVNEMLHEVVTSL